MKKIIFALALILLIAGCSKVQEYTSGCTWWTKENCNIACSTDADCIQSRCGNCVNIQETCKTTKWTELGTEAVDPSLIKVECICIQNQCVPAG